MNPMTVEPSEDAEWIEVWSGGGYEGREGIAISPTPAGLFVAAWYDGGVELEGAPLLTWERIDEMRAACSPEHKPHPR